MAYNQLDEDYQYQGPSCDEEGRLIDPEKLAELYREDIPEDLKIFVSKWQQPSLAPVLDGAKASKCVWGELDFVVQLKRLDIFTFPNPHSQQASANKEQSMKIR